MSGYYHYHRRQAHYRPELVFPVTMVAILLMVLIIACVSWILPDEPLGFVETQERQMQKPSRFERFIQGMKRAWKDAAKDE